MEDTKSQLLENVGYVVEGTFACIKPPTQGMVDGNYVPEEIRVRSDFYAPWAYGQRTQTTVPQRTATMCNSRPTCLCDTQRFEQLGVLDGQLDNLLDFSDLLLQPPDHVVRRVRHLFYFHQAYQRVHLTKLKTRELNIMC